MSWQDEVDELRRREELAKQMGGDERIQRQHDNGRLTVRERIDVLADDNSFHEIGALAGKARYSEDGELESFTPSNFVLGTARINGRRVVIGGDDFTVVPPMPRSVTSPATASNTRWKCACHWCG